MKEKITRIALVGTFIALVIAVYMLAADRYRENRDANRRAVEEYRLLQSNMIFYLKNAEGFILLYPFEGADSPAQRESVEQAKIINMEIIAIDKIFGVLANKESLHDETVAIRTIADEMNIYMNELGTEAYPANDTNLKYMENLFELMVKYRHAVEEELEAYRPEDEKDFFNSETYLKFKDIKQSIAEENTWVLAPATTKKGSSSEPGTTIPGIDYIPTVIHSQEEGLPFAREYFDKTYGNISVDKIETTGGGGSNIYGRMFVNYGYSYKNETVTLVETGNIDSVQFNSGNEVSYDESNLSQVTDEDMSAAESMAKDFLKKHSMENFTLRDKRGDYGRIYLEYSDSPLKDYFDYLNVMQFFFVNGEKVSLEYVSYPRYVESQVMDKKQFEVGYKKKEKLIKAVESQYKVLNAYYQKSGQQDNVETYIWNFLVERGGEQYYIIIDADTEKIIGAHTASDGKIMN